MMMRLSRRLHRDQRGALIVMQVAWGLVIVGFLWMVISSGQRLIQKETIQSSADGATFAAAVVKAKALNLIAFCNLTIALCAAILGVLQAMVNAFPMTILTLILMCAGGDEEACASIPDAEASQTDFQGKLAQSEQRLAAMGGVMPALSDAEQAIVEGIDDWVKAEATYVGTHEAYQKNFGHGLHVDVGPTDLPVMIAPDDNDVCASAWRWAAPLEGLFALQIPNLLVRSIEMGETQMTIAGGMEQWCNAVPPHYVLSQDWMQRRFVCGASTLEESNLDYRRETVGMALVQKPGPPRSGKLVTAARAEFLPWWGEADLWHMDWRARLVKWKDCDGGPQVDFGDDELKKEYLQH
jgi:hypothetical protein